MNVSIAAAVAAGVVSFMSPCVLPLVPGYVSFIAGRSGSVTTSKLRTATLSQCFILGFATIFVALGASATVKSHSNCRRVHILDANGALQVSGKERGQDRDKGTIMARFGKQTALDRIQDHQSMVREAARQLFGPTSTIVRFLEVAVPSADSAGKPANTAGDFFERTASLS